MAYAKGKQAYGICDISGFRYKLKDMKRTWDGLLVGPDQWNAKHPQLEPKTHAADPEALFNPRPDKAEDGGTGFVVVTSPSITKNFSMLSSTIPSKFELAKLSSNLGDISVLENSRPPTSADLSGVSATISLGTPTVTGNISISFNVTGQAGTASLNNPYVANALQTFAVTVVGGNPSNHPYYNFGSSNKFAIDGSTSTGGVTLNLIEGATYRFDQSDSSNSGHPLRFSTTANGTHGGGTEYTTGVTTNGTPGSSGAYTQITVAIGAPTLYYYCSNHSGMGWTANTV